MYCLKTELGRGHLPANVSLRTPHTVTEIFFDEQFHMDRNKLNPLVPHCLYPQLRYNRQMFTPFFFGVSRRNLAAILRYVFYF